MPERLKEGKDRPLKAKIYQVAELKAYWPIVWSFGEKYKKAIQKKYFRWN